MLTIKIPGRDEMILNHLILDYNGTIAEDGTLIGGVAPRLEELSRFLEISVITADTHGTASGTCKGLPLVVKTYPASDVGAVKAAEVRAKTGDVVCIGNGFNDIMMSEVSDLSVCVIGREGCCGALISRADVVVTSILDALDLLLRTDRLRATLRT